MWVDWIRRAHQGGLRLMVALSHNNRLLGDLAKGKCSDPARPCLPSDDQASSKLQINEIRDFVLRHGDFMELAFSSADVYRIVRGNKIAVVLGIEIDNIGNFRVQSPPSPKQITDELASLYADGVRYIFPVHVTDNVFGGTAPYNGIFDAANVYETDHFWDVECAGTQPFPDDEIGFKTPDLSSVDALMKSIPDPFSSLIPKGIPLPMAPQNCAAGHRNKKGLNPNIGAFAIKEMMRLGFIIDVDHMSHRTVEDVLGIAESIPGGGYPLMSGHNGIRDRGHFNTENSRTRSQLDRIGCLGGMFGLGTDHAELLEWAVQYRDARDVIRHRSPRCPNKEIGVGAVALGTDVNSLVQSPKPLMESLDPGNPDRNLNVYANTSRFPTSPSTAGGTPPLDFRTHGVAHYGMYADFIKAVWSYPATRDQRLQGSGQQLVEGNLDRNADNFWRMWVKVDQQKRKVVP
jgi:microsomal dipeptidase-like Zn-dependent dipeptidase